MSADLVLITLCMLGLIYSAIVWSLIGAIWAIVRKEERPGKPNPLIKWVAKTIIVIADGHTVRAKSMGITIAVTKMSSAAACERAAEELATEIAKWVTSVHTGIEYKIVRMEK